MYRYQGFANFTPYIGAGPSLNIIRITGTGYSGIFVDPPVGDSGTCQGSFNPTAPSCSNVSNTHANLGVNFKVGAEYKMDKDWGLAGEYHYTWTPVDISHFRSAQNLNGDYTSQTLSIVLLRHF